MTEMVRKIQVSLEICIPGHNPELRHQIKVELDYGYGDAGGIVVKGGLPSEETRGGHPVQIEAKGKKILSAVLGWLIKVDGHMQYLPHYRKEGK